MAANKNKGKVLSKYESGDKYGFLTLTGKGYLKPTKTGSLRYVECICVCGKIWFSLLTKIKKGGTKSCGCKKGEFLALAKTTHGMSSNKKPHPLYRAWHQIQDRCSKPNKTEYINYGFRGIGVCEEWVNSFDLFYKWSIENGWKKGLTLDRINNDGNYEPSNCRWVTHKVQNRNKRTNVLITAFGKIKCMVEWAEDKICQVSYSGLRTRIFKWGWEPEKAISTPKMNSGGGRKKQAA